MKASFFFVLVSLVSLLSSCSDGDGKRDPIKYKGYIPNFSVNAPDTSASRKMLKSIAGEALESLAHEETSGSRIDCSAQLENWNTISANRSYRLPTAVSDESVGDCANNPTVFCAPKRIGMLLNLYAQSQFYDCNARQQLQEDGLTKQCGVRDGSAGTNTIGDNDLCDNTKTPTDIQLLYAYTKDEANPDNRTRFVSWTMAPQSSATEDLEGLMINKYLQSSDGRKTKTRVDLTRTAQLKTVDSTLAIYNGTTDVLLNIARVHIKEGGSNGNVTDNYIVGRYWNSTYAKVLVIKGHIKKGTGSSVFYKTCAASDEAAALASNCDLTTSETPTFFDSSDAETSSRPTGVVNTWNDANFAAPAGNHLTSFFNAATTTAQVITDRFNPDLFSPDNP